MKHYLVIIFALVAALFLWGQGRGPRQGPTVVGLRGPAGPPGPAGPVGPPGPPGTSNPSSDGLAVQGVSHTISVSAGNARVGATTYTYPPATASVTVGSGTARIGVDTTNHLLTAWHTFASMTCNVPMVCAQAAGWPPNAIQLSECYVTSGTIDSCTDKRAFLSSDPVAAGFGLVEAAGVVSANPAVVPAFQQSASVPVGSCTSGTLHLRTTGQLWVCIAAAWVGPFTPSP